MGSTIQSFRLRCHIKVRSYGIVKKKNLICIRNRKWISWNRYEIINIVIIRRRIVGIRLNVGIWRFAYSIVNLIVL